MGTRKMIPTALQSAQFLLMFSEKYDEDTFGADCIPKCTVNLQSDCRRQSGEITSLSQSYSGEFEAVF